MKILSVIIVNYNVREFLEQAILSVQNACKNIDHEIFVVDNASSDGSVRMIREKFPIVKVIDNKVNVGFSRANNMAIRESSSKFISLLNPDTIVREDTFEIIIKGFEDNPHAGMIGSKVLNSDGTLQKGCRRSFPSPGIALSRMLGLSVLFPKSKMFAKYNLTYLHEDETASVDAISGAFMTVRKETIEQAGMLDEDYFMYGEDLDWCFQIKKAGWDVLYYPKTSIVHYKGESSRQSSWNQLKLFYEAMVIFSKKHFKSYNVFTPLWLLKLSILIRAALASIIRVGKNLAVPAIDAAVINGSLFTAIYIRYGEMIQLPFYGDVRDYLLLSLISTIPILFALFIQGVYPRHRYSVKRAFLGAIIGTLGVALIIFLSRWLAVSRLVILMSAALQVIFIAGWRYLLRLMVTKAGVGKYSALSDDFRPVNYLIIGSDELSCEVYDKFKNHPVFGSRTKGLIDTMQGGDKTIDKERYPVLGQLTEIVSVIRREKISDIIFAASGDAYNQIIDIITLCQKEKVDFKLVPNSLELIIGKATVVPFGEIPLVDIEYKFFEGANRFMKRTLDITLASLLFFLFLPFYFITKVVLRLKTKSRLIFGEYGEPVYVKEVLKDSKKYYGAARLFPLLSHAIKGDMSLVGRPLSDADNPEFTRISLLKPGLFPCVMGGFRESDMKPSSTFELTYLKNYTILYDFTILLKNGISYAFRYERSQDSEVDNSHS